MSDTLATDPYFGLNVDTLGGVKGYADFLYSLADNTVLVREGRKYDTRDFMDVYTKESLVLAVFHLPANGLTTVLQLMTGTSDFAVKPLVRFVHYSYVAGEEMGEFRSTIGFLIFTCFCVIFFNLGILRRLYMESQTLNPKP